MRLRSPPLDRLRSKKSPPSSLGRLFSGVEPFRWGDGPVMGQIGVAGQLGQLLQASEIRDQVCSRPLKSPHLRTDWRKSCNSAGFDACESLHNEFISEVSLKDEDLCLAYDYTVLYNTYIMVGEWLAVRRIHHFI